MFARIIRFSKLSYALADVSYWMLYLPSMTYPLPSTSLSKKALDKVESPAIRAVLNASGYNSNFPRAVVYGPRRLGGMAKRSLYTEQGVQKTTLLLRHLRGESVLANWITIGLEYYQLIAGISQHILEEVDLPLPHAEGGWITSLRLFLSECGAHLKLPEAWVPLMHREDACCIINFIPCLLYSPDAAAHEAP